MKKLSLVCQQVKVFIVLEAQETHELKYIFFYLHENEAYFNDRINTFLTAEGDRIHPERFMDLKLECRIEVLRRFQDYDPDKNAKFTTYIHRYITDVMLRFRMEEEYSSFDSLQEYKDARQIMQLYCDPGDIGSLQRKAAEEDNCSCTRSFPTMKIPVDSFPVKIGYCNRTAVVYGIIHLNHIVQFRFSLDSCGMLFPDFIQAFYSVEGRQAL